MVALLIMPGSEISLIFGQKITADQFIAHKQVQQLELGLLTVLRSRSFTPIMAWSQSPRRTVYSSTERQGSRHTSTLETKPLGHIIGELDNLQDRGSDVGHVLEGKKEVLEELDHLVLNLVPDQVFLLVVDFILLVELQVLLKILP